MTILFDPVTGINPQDSLFLDREVWDLVNTPADKRPLLLHYHPLVIYRFQVLKQADVVLALFLQGDHFTAEQKRVDFEYYDPITTGDSTLSGVVQSIIAAEVGYADLALRYFENSLYVDLANLHGNTSDGVHVASTGGVWNALVYGFAGMRDYNGVITFDPRLPDALEGPELPADAAGHPAPGRPRGAAHRLRRAGGRPGRHHRPRAPRHGVRGVAGVGPARGPGPAAAGAHRVARGRAPPRRDADHRERPAVHPRLTCLLLLASASILGAWHVGPARSTRSVSTSPTVAARPS